MSNDPQTTKKKKTLPLEFSYGSWERRGWRFYVGGTQKEIFRVRLAHKTSEQAEQITNYIQAALEAYHEKN